MPSNYLTSSLTSLRHGFFTREGGVSKEPYKSLNVTTRVGDSADNVLKNRKIALKKLNLDVSNLAFLNQLDHADKILAVSDAAKGLDFNGYDAIMTNKADIVLGVSVADCPVVILISEVDPAVALVHSGWRGCRVNVVPKTVQAMIQEYGVDPKNVKAIIGPSIGVDNYRVGKDVTKQFDKRYIVTKENHDYLDLKLIIKDQLSESGIKMIDLIDIDTYSDDRFFSYRRDHGDTGRSLVIATL